MPENKPQPDDLTPQDIEALEKELHMREIEDQWFGRENAMATTEELDEEGRLRIDCITRQVSKKVAEGVEKREIPDSPGSVIDALQEQDRLKESIHTPTLVKFLEFLGKKFGLRIKVGEFTMFPANAHAITLNEGHLDRFLVRGAIAGSFLGGLLISSSAFAQEFQPGMDILNDPNFQVVSGAKAEDVWHLEYVAALLLLLGLTSYGVYKLIKWYKEQKPYKEKAKEVKKYYTKYEEAVATGEGDKIAHAKHDLAVATMAELPSELEKVDLGDDVSINALAIAKVLEWKKKVDMSISDATLDIEKAMVLPKKPTISNLNAQKDQVYNLLASKIKQVLDLIQNIEAAKSSLNSTKDKYLIQQLNLEMEKLKYFVKYLELMKKKWLVFIQNAKNKIISSSPYEKLDVEDKLQHDILKLKDDLSSLLDAQATKGLADFKAHMASIEAALDTKTGEAASRGVTGFTPDEPEVVDLHVVQLFEGGKYDHGTPIHYKVNGADEKTINLNEHFAVQIWINGDKTIQMNLNYKDNLVETQVLKIVTDGNLHIKATDQPLADHIAEKHADPAILGIEASTIDIGPEAEPVLNQLAAHVKTVNEQIESGTYSMFGKKVEADDDAIKYHTIKVHREYYKGKPITVARFTLSEQHWKKALAHLSGQHDIPKHTIDYNYQNAHGETVHVNQEMRRFNIVMNGKQAFVLIPSTEKLMALAGEVRVVFDPKMGYTDQEVKAIFAEAVKRLGIAGHVKEVTAAARAKEQKRLLDIRKESYDAAGSKTDVHTEYDAEQVEPASVEELKKKGLHSIYHQFSIDVLEKTFKSGYLLATTTRWAKGELKHGLSSTADMANGGATEVFTRIHTTASAKNNIWHSHDKPAIVFKSDLFKRADCYCYTSDQYGSKKPGTFDQRVSPRKLVEIMGTSYSTGNEVMFHDAVKVEDAAYIVYGHPDTVIARLKKMGVTQLGGKPIEKAVITPGQFSQLDHV